MPPQVIILDGPSGAGKSTLAKALQDALLPTMWLHFSIDSIIYALPPSVLERCNTQNDWTGVDDDAIQAGAFACLNSLASNGNAVIFDAVIANRKRADQLLAAISDHRVAIIGVCCAWEEIKRRTLARGDRTLAEAEHSFVHSPTHFTYDFIVDTTATPPAEVAKICIDKLRALK